MLAESNMLKVGLRGKRQTFAVEECLLFGALTFADSAAGIQNLCEYSFSMMISKGTKSFGARAPRIRVRLGSAISP